jgi:signal transduction histidine kinase
MASLRSWALDLAVGLGVLLIGFVEIVQNRYYVSELQVGIALGFAVASGLARRVPSLALLVVWLTCAGQLYTGTEVLAAEFFVAWVAFACARWGSVATVVVSGLSIPAAGGIGLLLFVRVADGDYEPIAMFSSVIDNARQFGDTVVVGAIILGLLILAVPWLAGLVVRSVVRARRSEASEELAQADAVRAHQQAEQAQEIARLRDEQARLARDVHDVVGHSLAVILAQAESAQYLPDDPAKLKETMATIATSARTSLQDVRQVLAQPGAEPARAASFEELLEGVRRTGQDVALDEVGTPRPLPPELDVVAYRVMQEMLTNAVKHGRRDRPIHVERHWPQDAYERDLRLEVSNSTPVAETDLGETQPISVTPSTDGQGLSGMRRRVESVGGRLDVRRRSGPDGPTFTTTVWVPVRR